MAVLMFAIMFKKEMKIVIGQQHMRKHLVSFEEMAQIGSE